MLYQPEKTLRPPSSEIGIVPWILKNLFSNVFDGFLTILGVALLFIIIPPILEWSILDATFFANNAYECSIDGGSKGGACWAYIGEKINLFIYGFYPEDQRWRIDTLFILLILLVIGIRFVKNAPLKHKLILASFVVFPLIAFWLIHGGIGLKTITTDQWGGLLLTIVVASTGIVFSFPIGIVFALGRRSRMPIAKWVSIIYIEFIRGVPLISILFMASVVLPLFLSEGLSIDKLLRALIGIVLFQSAYIAEVIRGGLQAIPRGQYEAADAMGFSFFHKMVFIILPQALKVSIPNLVGSFISLFKDTTLVLIIGLFDMLAMVGLTSSDSHWLGMEIEGYVFVTMVFWVILYNMSRYASSLERRFTTKH